MSRPIDSDPTATAIRAAIVALASLLNGGASITHAVGNAETKAAGSRKRSPYDLHALNWGNPATSRALGDISNALRLARIVCAGDVLDADRIARDAAYIATADALHSAEGECELDAQPDALAPLRVSAGDGGAYVSAWVWVPRKAMEKTLAEGLHL